MRVLRVDVALAPGLAEPRTAAIRRRLGLGAEVGVEVFDVWWVEAADEGAIGTLETLVCDAGRVRALPREGPAWTALDVALLPGMTDSAATELLEAWSRLPQAGPAPRSAASGLHIAVASEAGVDHGTLAGALVNPIIECHAVGGALDPFGVLARAAPGATRIPMRGATDASLRALGLERQLSLDLPELRAIAAHFEALGRDPTDVEVELLAQTWSEHCNHKTFRADIELAVLGSGGEETRRQLPGLLETCFEAPTRRLARPWVVSAFEDNAGRVALMPGFEVAAKVETHNRPSALAPFAGAMTGVGGVLRDILGVSARPFAALDVLAFGPAGTPVRPGFLPVDVVREGVVAGIADYGNRFGVPTVAGALLEHPAHATNPLVFAGALGILPAGAHPTRPAPGDLVVVAGGATGRDGLRGATFSSGGLDGASASTSGGAVQLGDPLMGRLVMELVLEARDAGLYHTITDCGAGGLSSAVGELARRLGAEISMADILSKYSDMAPWELWLSESQERMVLAVPRESWPSLQALAVAIGCPVAAIGTFRGDGRLVVKDGAEVVVDLDLAFVHGGCPRRRLSARWSAPRDVPEEAPALVVAGRVEPTRQAGDADWLATLERYDVEIQGGTRVRPVVGRSRRGRGEGVVLRPLELDGVADAPHVALGLGLCPELSAVDPRVMAWLAVDEALRQVVAVGADPARVALLDNFAWGDVDSPEGLGSLALACIGCAEAAELFGTPFISGKDSLRNTYRLADGTRRSIPGTLVVTAVGRVPPGVQPLCPGGALLGDAVLWLGRSAVGAAAEAWLPSADTPALYAALHGAIASGLLTSCRDVHTGGIPGALERLATAAGRALHIDAPPPPEPSLAGTHTAGRFVATARREALPALSAALEGHPCRVIGRVI